MSFRSVVGMVVVVCTVPAIAFAQARQSAAPKSSGTVIPVIGHDYALQSPDSVSAGLTTFRFENRGAKEHELLIGLLQPGVGVREIEDAHRKGTPFRFLPSVYLEGSMSGMLYALPGTSSPASLAVPMASGRAYILLCQLRDTIGAPQHAALGMFRIIHVR